MIAYRDAVTPSEDRDACDSPAQNLEEDLILLAIVGIVDPLRYEAITAIEQCNRAGITVRMLTGNLSGDIWSLYITMCVYLVDAYVTYTVPLVKC